MKSFVEASWAKALARRVVQLTGAGETELFRTGLGGPISSRPPFLARPLALGLWRIASGCRQRPAYAKRAFKKRAAPPFVRCPPLDAF